MITGISFESLSSHREADNLALRPDASYNGDQTRNARNPCVFLSTRA